MEFDFEEILGTDICYCLKDLKGKTVGNSIFWVENGFLVKGVVDKVRLSITSKSDLDMMLTVRYYSFYEDKIETKEINAYDCSASIKEYFECLEDFYNGNYEQYFEEALKNSNK